MRHSKKKEEKHFLTKRNGSKDKTFHSIHRDKRWNGGFQRLQRGRNEESLFNGYRLSFWKDEKFWRWMVLMVTQQGEYV